MRKRLGFVLGSLCLLLFASQANSVTDRVTLAPAEFHPVNGAAEQLIGRSGWGDYVYRADASTANTFFAQLNVPHGAIIKYVRFHYMDNDASNDMACALVRTNKYTGSTLTIYLIWSTGASSSIQYLDDSSAPAPSYSLTNTDACNYYIYLELDGKGQSVQRFYGVTVVYEI
jgi:hypothetical protein